MALTNGLEGGQDMPRLPSERQPHDFSERDRVIALYYRTWMDGPELIHGVVSDVYAAERPDVNGSPGFVNLKTAKTPDLRTGSFIGIDVNSAALIPEDALPHMEDESFLMTWLADGSVAWPGEREMLEETLRARIAQGNLRPIITSEPTAEHYDVDGHHHPTRAREHTKMIPGSGHGKVGTIRLRDLAGDETH